MALQIRRGVEADRTSFTPAQGEPLFVTDTNKVYIGDGSTAGGVEVGGGGGGGGSDGTVPLITQAYAVTEGYGRGDFEYAVMGNGYVRPPAVHSYGVAVTRAGVIDIGVTSTVVSGGGGISSNGASIGGFNVNYSYRGAASVYLARNTITGVLRIPSVPTASAPFQAGLSFVDKLDFNQNSGGIGAFGISVYVDKDYANWRIAYRGGDDFMGELTVREEDTGVPKNTAWRKIEIITEYNSSTFDTAYTVKIDGSTVNTTSSNTLYTTYGIDMGYGGFLTPQLAIRSAGNGSAGRMEADHLSILSEVVR